ncbi:hypothetical protein A7C99_0589 [Trichophyton rubrum]|uniref:Uncharacterized protein n=1 Tax=Trichophyton rubrum TaxID=5551 RepID=A0A178F733_TRIRU|nr:hypothetical protein A7C99_0589 [Trichophyton rubrum]
MDDFILLLPAPQPSRSPTRLQRQCLREPTSADSLRPTVNGLLHSCFALKLALERPPVWLDMAADMEDPSSIHRNCSGNGRNETTAIL